VFNPTPNRRVLLSYVSLSGLDEADAEELSVLSTSVWLSSLDEAEAKRLTLRTRCLRSTVTLTLAKLNREGPLGWFKRSVAT